ncbi:MAG: L,D-transpeptidase [Roseiarcus sp.]|uniref:L,D-transpeptidase family protein n=1 Tax=Roseiarcus sp. TaxID=1969460 RepID=UPI003C5085C1
MSRLIAVFFLAALTPFTAAAAHRTPGAVPQVAAASINASAPSGKNDSDPSLIAKAEVLLDRDHFSPGEIDGVDGDNYRRAVRAFQQSNSLSATGILDAGTWNALTSNVSEPVLKPYTITDADLAGPFDRLIPVDLKQMAQLPGLSYTSPLAELAEKFHMNMEFLRRLNPRADFEHPGQQIVVADVKALNLRAGRDTFEAAPANIKDEAASESVTTIVVDKPARNVRAYDEEGKLLAYYPATIGSEEKPAPSGAFKVRGVSWNPDYIYDPKFAWKGVNVRHKLTIRPGPNNPVGLVWIDLTAPTYGIHGTPEPADIGKTESHGCIRLTNWDAVDLAAMVRPGTIVKFEDEDSPVAPLPGPMSERRGLEIDRRQP